MKLMLLSFVAFAVLQQSTCSPQNIGSVLDQVSGTGITDQDAANGLKEALVQGATNGSDILAKLNGYFGNPQVKIPFPPEAKKIETTLRDIGLNKMCDDVILSVNRAAEDAAVQAKPILISAIRSMTISDAMNILFGADNAATEYLKRTTTSQLTAKFKPVIETSLKKVNATKYWSDAVNYYNKIPLVDHLNPDLSGYVTQKALDGLFLMIQNEELKIRDNPGARLSDIVKKVFGYYDTHK